MTQPFGILPSGEAATLYTISMGSITAHITDYGATLVRLFVPDSNGAVADVVLGHDDCNGYRTLGGSLGATVGRNANRIKDAAFTLNGKQVTLSKNNGANNLHSGPDVYGRRLWKAMEYTDDSITFELNSPDGDQGFPGNAVIRVTYELDADHGLHIRYDAVSDQDTVFNLTNHSYFNLAGHEKTADAMQQLLQMPSQFFCPNDADSVPTGQLCPVADTPMDFCAGKPLSQDIQKDYLPLNLQNGYDHNWVVSCNPCAVLQDKASGRCMSVHTDCPGMQLYTGNALNITGKDGVYYGKRSGVALETQFYPDAVHHPDWPQPITKANTHYQSETIYRFSW